MRSLFSSRPSSPAKKTPQQKQEPTAAARIQACADKKLIFDCHLHYLGYLQTADATVTELAGEMEKNGIGYAAITGCAFKKSWMSRDEKVPEHHLYDDGDLYYYSMTDALIHRDLQLAGPAISSYFSMLACGFNLGDAGSGLEAQSLVDRFGDRLSGFGELTLQSDDVNNMTLKGGNWTHFETGVKAILDVAKVQPKPMPIVFYSDARSISTKPYRGDFEYIGEIEMVCSHARNVNCVWVAAGTFARGQWAKYADVVHALLAANSNLYISLTPEVVLGKYEGISRADALQLAKDLPHRVVLGTTIRAFFKGKPPTAFHDMDYAEQTKALVDFANLVEEQCGAAVAASLRYHTAAKLFNLELPEDASVAKVQPQLQITDKTHSVIEVARRQSTMNMSQTAVTADAATFLRRMSYGGGVVADQTAESQMAMLASLAEEDAAVCPPSATKKWDTIDCHLHLLDFLQKSSGTTAALKAMDGCDCMKAVVFGMPCCKKWCFYREDQPLYYQDDNGPCYVYAYADQMVADAWLALPDESRKRLAPCFASFDPTDLAAISHVKRMHDKYPKMWRGIGEVMCRHDDLTTMLLGKEVPKVNHRALHKIYDFAVEKSLPVLVHHNADRVGDNDDDWEYVHEVEEVLGDARWAKLTFVWVHAGVSRRCSEPDHHKMIDRLCSTYPNLMVDISWVVWEDVICDENKKVKDGWVETIQKHHTRFFIGSDNVAQFFPIRDTSVNLLASNITKYYALFERLTPEAAENVASKNAERLYFDKWDVPSGERGRQSEHRYLRADAFYPCEALDPNAGKFVEGSSELDDVGKY